MIIETKKGWWLLFLVAAVFGLSGCDSDTLDIHVLIEEFLPQAVTTDQRTMENDELPGEYDGGYTEIVLNENKPTFTEADLDLSHGVWQIFSDLDHLNRVGVANALIGKESFPTDPREPLSIKPSGWNQKKLADGQWLYNRCHLVGHQMTGENNNPKNLMTGTRSFNTPHMLNYENQVMDYIKLTGNHVRYRVTPHFVGNELVARGIQMEAEGIEDQQFSYNVYIYNVQEGYTIDYSTGRATKK
ncbi:DNA/RNA non-specific endonuclease [Enterococcus ureasiticus]|uniref:DNA/RNA non-specific endonuclease n=1 Tax=Enterococcus ureasiticus TaxID=903984 RepID=UPI001A8EB90B|nr:DNA/RNA non-specific endonuclease [Enterococcus ureasiticus]MBO0474863.1 DNA/RNA non-specific endonuclease [Enterococcus ureasiticus]